LRTLTIAAVAVALISFGAAAIAQPASVQFDGSTFKVAGWKVPRDEPARGWSSVLAIYAGTGNIPTLLGTYAVEGGTLVFRPRFPIASGVEYHAILKLPGNAPVEQVFDGPRQSTVPVARVLHIYPSAGVLPSNQLRLYVYFSAPMSRGEAARYVHVVDENGNHLEGPRGIFLPGEELWDPNFERLTLTFDPGRIKRGLTSNETVGPPIVPGKLYTLMIDRDWPDARGVPMTAGFKKQFRGGPALRTLPDAKQWRVTAPKAGTSDAVVVDFPEPMNFALLQRMIQVSDGRRVVTGTMKVARDEAEWQFTPNEKWKAGNYTVLVDTALEDLAGNHVGQAFDIDIFDKVTEHITTTRISLAFTVH
jgi:hypothetical protein